MVCSNLRIGLLESSFLEYFLPYLDTGYTERYMATPDDNPIGYRNGSVLHYVENFPDSENRLLIVHGLKDENVHFCHTAALIEALISAGKTYQLYLYPKERHGIRNYSSFIHLETKLLSLLLKYL